MDDTPGVLGGRIEHGGVPHRPDPGAGADGQHGWAGRRGYDLRLPGPHAPHAEILNLADHNEGMAGAVLRCQLRQLTHTKTEKLGSFSLAFSGPTAVKPFQADYSILSAELPAKAEGKLLFKFGPSSAP